MLSIFKRIKNYFFPPKSLELETFNPLNLKVGSHLEIDSIQVRGVEFKLNSLQRIDRKDSGHFGKIADYSLEGHKFSTNEHLDVTLRVYDSHGDDRILVLLEKISSFGFDEEIYEKLNNTKDLSIEFEEEHYWRINDLKTPWECYAEMYVDINKDSTVDSSEVMSGSLKIWDYWRELEDKSIEFLFVQMDANGFFEMLRGRKISAEQVQIR